MEENDWKKQLSIAFSRDPELIYQREESEEQLQDVTPQREPLIVSIDRRSRAGKQVTLVKRFSGTVDELEALGKILKGRCGTGGSCKDGEIIIQGDFRDKVVSELINLGYRAKRGN